MFSDSKKVHALDTTKNYQNLIISESQNDSWDGAMYLAVCSESSNSSMMQDISNSLKMGWLEFTLTFSLFQQNMQNKKYLDL